MGIFNKKPAKPKTEDKAEPKCELCGNIKEHKRHALYGNDIDSAVKHTFVPAEPHKAGKAEELKKIDMGNGVEAIEGKFPEGFDPTDPAKLQEFLQGVLKDAGVLPPDATIKSMELVKLPKEKAGKMAGVAIINNSRKGEATKAELKEAAARFKSMKGKPVHMIPAPQDPAKAAFVNALNCFHKRTHELGPLLADLYQAFECLELSMKATTPTPRQKARFKAFELTLVGMIAKMSEFGCEVCEVAELTERAGIPVPDSPAVIN